MAPSGDNNRLDNEELQRKLKERKEEIELFGRFKQITTAKLNSMANQTEESGVKYSMGEKEKEILSQLHGMGIKEGVAAGLVTFFILRRGPIYVGRWVLKRRQQSQSYQQQSSQGFKPLENTGGYQFTDPNAATTNPFQRVANPSNPQFPRSKNIVIRSIWFAFDSVLSLMMAASISMAYTDTDRIRQQLVELPLIPGKSLTADSLCDEIVQELRKVQQEHNPTYERLKRINNNSHGSTPASYYLEGIVGFSENCQRRQFMERQLRQESGLGPYDKVEIPEPGVPRDGPRLIDNSEGGEEEVSTDTFDYDFGDETKWASDFVADQEEDWKKR